MTSTKWMEKSGERATINFVLTKLREAAGNKAVPDQRAILARPIDERIFFAGEATSSNSYASVHGACISGRDAARATVT